MNSRKMLLKALALIVSCSCVSMAFTYPSSVQAYYGSGAGSTTAIFNLDGSGNVTVTGGLTVSGKTASSVDGSFGASGASPTAISGNVTVTGNEVVIGTQAVTGQTVYNRVTESGVTSSSAIINTASFVVITTTNPAATVIDLATPTISTITATDGQFIVIKGTSATATYTFQDNGTLAGSLVELGAASRVVSDLKVLTLMFDSLVGKWIEVNYGNN